MLTHAAVTRARSRDAAYKLADGRGLHLYVAPSGLRSWRLRFTWQGTEQLLTIGSYPEVTLDQARAAADVARARRARGEDPRTPDGAANDAEVRAFEYAARAWIERKRPSWTPVHAADVLAALERDIFPAIGAIPLPSIEKPDILAALGAVEDRGAVATAHKLKHWVGCVFDYASAKGWTRTNPASGIGEAMADAAAVEHHPALTDIVELRALLAAAARVPAGVGPQLALRFLALTAVRYAAVRGATWAEIEDLDGPAPIWRVPAARMKLEAAKKLDAANDHLVPLAPAAVAVLRAARANMHGGDADLHDRYIFAGRGGRAAIGEKALSDLHVRAGYKDRHVPHGWRASFSTILNEWLPDQRGAIDRALAHVGASKDEKAEEINRQVEGAYNRATYLPQRRALFDAWADMLVPVDAGGCAGQ